VQQQQVDAVDPEPRERPVERGRECGAVEPLGAAAQPGHGSRASDFGDDLKVVPPAGAQPGTEDAFGRAGRLRGRRHRVHFRDVERRHATVGGLGQQRVGCRLVKGLAKLHAA
jgi:hypothetical protein